MKRAGHDRESIEKLCQQLIEHPEEAELSTADRAMMDYALQLTKQPQSIERNSIDRLRGEGFDDLAIHDLCCIVSYFAFVNRVADGLGVELERESG